MPIAIAKSMLRACVHAWVGVSVYHYQSAVCDHGDHHIGIFGSISGSERAIASTPQQGSGCLVSFFRHLPFLSVLAMRVQWIRGVGSQRVLWPPHSFFREPSCACSGRFGPYDLTPRIIDHMQPSRLAISRLHISSSLVHAACANGHGTHDS